nr:reverse transcriptase domain-containing protein [Tanacetum cinerariifolium]
MGENRDSWSDKLEYALCAFRTAFKTSIGCTPYRLVYGKSCHLPLELEHKAYWVLKHANFDLKTAGDHRKLQLNKLNELRDQAYENSLIYKERTKKLHDDKIKNRIFNVGDQVLLFNSRLKIFSGKLKSRWSGPFTISEIYPYGTTKLIHPDGCNFKVNCHRLKHYHGGDPPPLEIPDDYLPKIEDFLCRILSWFSRPSYPLIDSSLGMSLSAIAWKLTDIKGIDPEFCSHKILLEEDYSPKVQSQRRVNPKIHDVIKKEVEKLLDARLIYPISDNPWVSPIHCVPNKGGMTVIKNDENELVPTHLVTGWRVCIDYRKLNEATRKDHFSLPFMDQMLERLAGNEYYCFLDGFSGYFQISIDPKDQEKTTFTCPYGTFAYKQIPFVLCNAPGTF